MGKDCLTSLVFLFSQQEIIQVLHDEWLLYLQSHVLLELLQQLIFLKFLKHF